MEELVIFPSPTYSVTPEVKDMTRSSCSAIAEATVMPEEAKASGKLWNQPFGLYRLIVQTALSVPCPDLHFWGEDAPCEVTECSSS